MTIIPHDDTGIPERIHQAGQRTEENARRLAAAIAGALEGFVEALEEYDIKDDGKRAVQQASEITRAASSETRAFAQSPEMQQVGHGLSTAGHATADAATRVGDKVSHQAQATKDSVRHATQTTRDTIHDGVQHAKDGVHHAREQVGEAVESAKYAAQRVKEEVRVRGEAVAESGRRAKVAPRRIGHELYEAYAAWKRGLVTSIAMAGVLIIFSTIALIVLTIALVVGLNALLGDPAGTFVVALLYVVIAGIAWAVARSARTKASRESEERVANAREEARHVARPVREAFSRGRTGI